MVFVPDEEKYKPGYDWKKSRMLKNSRKHNNYGPGKGGSSDPRPLGTPGKQANDFGGISIHINRPYKDEPESFERPDTKSLKNDPIIRREALTRRMKKIDEKQEENKPRKKVGYNGIR
jgi:hypothetical protein